MQVQSLGREDPLEEGMATHSSILAWRIPWTEEPGGLFLSVAMVNGIVSLISLSVFSLLVYRNAKIGRAHV